jgi:hypothetical protein
MSATIAERVAKGAALLDEKRPGWDAAIDLAVLDLESCRLCVIGQLFGAAYEMAWAGRWPDGGWLGPFSYGVDALGLGPSLRAEFAHGFDGRSGEYADLTAEWRRLIAARRLAAERVSAS